MYDFTTEKDTKISFLFEYSKFLKEKKLSDSKIQTWQNENVLSLSNVNFENLNKRVIKKIKLFYNFANIFVWDL